MERSFLMLKFAIECPECGKVTEGKTGLFEKKEIKQGKIFIKKQILLNQENFIFHLVIKKPKKNLF